MVIENIQTGKCIFFQITNVSNSSRNAAYPQATMACLERKTDKFEYRMHFFGNFIQKINGKMNLEDQFRRQV